MINYRLINTGSLVKTIIVNDIDEAKILLQELKLNSFINSRDEFIEELDNFKECYYVQRLKEDDVVIELSD